jgi:hypothetical protein
MDKKVYLQCSCYSPEHLLTFSVWDEGDIYAHVFLAPEVWYKRIWKGLKYIFGYKCCYGHFDEFILNPKDIDRFIIMLNSVKKNEKS